MTDLPASVSRPEPVSFPQLWADCLAQVLSQIAGSSQSCLVTDRGPDSAAAVVESDLWIGGTCSGGLRGELSLRLDAATTLRIAQLFMSEPATPQAPVTAEHREATLELLRQVAGLVVTSLKARWGETPVRLETATGAPSWPASSKSWVQFGEQNSPAFLEIQLSAALAAGLRADKAESPKPSSTPATPATLPAEENRTKLGLLMDVELSVTLRFGGKRMLLREILDLNPGSVVELDRLVQEPVEMLLDGRLVARGEVVVINGEYGLRISEIAPVPA